MKKLKTYFEWDVKTWSRALPCWQSILSKNSLENQRALDIGSRGGGLSLFLAHDYKLSVVCSDLNNPEKTACILHKQFKDINIEYQAVDCTQIPYADNTFEVVIFKSVVGALSTFEKQKKAFDEIHRVLKPNGILLFAENLESSPIHMLLRKKFVRWSSYWRYLTFKDLDLFLSPFRTKHLESTGFLAIFFANTFMNTFFAWTDKIIQPILPRSYNYVVYGYAIK